MSASDVSLLPDIKEEFSVECSVTVPGCPGDVFLNNMDCTRPASRRPVLVHHDSSGGMRENAERYWADFNIVIDEWPHIRHAFVPLLGRDS
jgi:hypothetical protein